MIKRCLLLTLFLLFPILSYAGDCSNSDYTCAQIETLLDRQNISLQQSDCTGITSGWCMDTDDGIFYSWDGDSVEAVGLSTSSTVTKSIYWPAAAMSADGTQCGDPTERTINSGPITFTVICTDNDSSTLYGHVVMPDGWNAGTVTFELEFVQTAADTANLQGDVTAMCRGATETINNTWGTEVAMDVAGVSGSNKVDHTTSAAVTANGTCAAGDTLFWRWQMDATGTTTAVATLHILGMKMEYTATLTD